MTLLDPGPAVTRLKRERAGILLNLEWHGEQIGTASVSSDGSAAVMRFAMAHGRLPMNARRQLVDAAFELPELSGSDQVTVVIPVGDVDLLEGVRAHVTAPHSRAAGTTCLIDAVLPLTRCCPTAILP
jgi:hypothetical protein